MGKLSPENLLKRVDKAKEMQSRYLGLWDMAYRYTFPQKDILSQTPGARRGIQVYDSTAPDSIGRLSRRLKNDIFPKGVHWCNFEAGPDLTGSQRDMATGKLQEYRDKFFALIENSNFHEQMSECCDELMVGTAALLFQEGSVARPFKFNAVQITSLFIDEGPWGEVDGKFVRYEGPYRALKAMFMDFERQGFMKWPEEFAKKADAPETQDTKTELFDCVYTDWESGAICRDILWKEGKASILKKPIEEETSPWIVFRWAKNVGEVYGYGPAVTELPDILTVNKIAEYSLKGAAYRIAPISTVANDGTNPNNWRLEPGSFLPVERNDGHPNGASIGKLEFGGDPQLADLLLERRQLSIKRGFHDNSLPDEAGPVRSYGELVMRLREGQSDIGGVFSRISSEVVVPIPLRGLNIMKKRRLIEFPLVINGTTIKIVPTSPLAQLQNLSDIEGVTNWLQICQGLGPEAFMLGVKIEDVPSWFADKLGVPVALRRSEEERAKLQQDMAQIIASQNQPQAPAQPAQPMLRAAQ